MTVLIFVNFDCK